MAYDAYQHEPREYNAVDRELALSFTKILKDELKELLLEVIFFGSAARTPSKSI